MNIVGDQISGGIRRRMCHSLQVLSGALLMALLPVGHSLGQDMSLDVPSSVVAGSEFVVEWLGPGMAGERIAVVPRGGEPTPAGAALFAAFTAPEAPEDREIVYVDGASGAVLARRALEVL